jgi:hypothetical protein
VKPFIQGLTVQRRHEAGAAVIRQPGGSAPPAPSWSAMNAITPIMVDGTRNPDFSEKSLDVEFHCGISFDAE